MNIKPIGSSFGTGLVVETAATSPSTTNADTSISTETVDACVPAPSATDDRFEAERFSTGFSDAVAKCAPKSASAIASADRPHSQKPRRGLLATDEGIRDDDPLRSAHETRSKVESVVTAVGSLAVSGVQRVTAGAASLLNDDADAPYAAEREAIAAQADAIGDNHDTRASKNAYVDVVTASRRPDATGDNLAESYDRYRKYRADMTRDRFVHDADVALADGEITADERRHLNQLALEIGIND